MDFKFLYGDPRGRISRKTWWLGAIGLIIISIVVNMVLGVVATAFGLSKSAFGIGLMSLIAVAVLFFPYYALTVKRLHDRSRPTVLFWLFFAPSILSSLLMMLGVAGEMGTVHLFGTEAPAFQPNALGQAVTLLSFGVGVWALVELGFMKGQAGDNAYGADPLRRTTA